MGNGASTDGTADAPAAGGENGDGQLDHDIAETMLLINPDDDGSGTPYRLIPPPPPPPPANGNQQRQSPYPQLTSAQLRNLLAQGLNPDLAFLPYQMHRTSNTNTENWLSTNTHVQRATLQCYNSAIIRKNSLMLTSHQPTSQAGRPSNLHHSKLGFTCTIDCTVPATLTVWWLATEVVDDSNNTSSVNSALPSSVYHVAAGMNQQFSLPVEHCLEMARLTPDAAAYSSTQRYYPLVVQLQPTNAISQSADSRRNSKANASTTKQVEALYTSYTFLRSVHNTLIAKQVKQVVNVDKKSYTLEEVYGMSESQPPADDAIASAPPSPRSTTSGLNTHDCIICFSAPRDTIVLPCRHVSLCFDCGLKLKENNSAKCPLCRSVVESVVRIPPALQQPSHSRTISINQQIDALLLHDSSVPQAASTTTSSNQPEVRRLTPPRFDAVHIGERVLCHRPVRQHRTRIEVESVGNKTVLHQYGHGGSGWTIGPGSAKYAVDLLLQHFRNKRSNTFTTSTPITVLGAGVIGLFTALELYDRGYRKLHVVAEEYHDIASHHAGGLWGLTTMSNDPAFEQTVHQMALHSYRTYKQVIDKQHSHLKRGARHMPAYFPSREDSAHEEFVGTCVRPAVDVLLDFGTGVQRPMVAYDDGIFMDTPQLLHDLQNKLTELGVTFEQRTVASLSEISSSVIVNCCGIGAQSLCNDKDVVSVQGHLLMLTNQESADLEYMLACADQKPTVEGDFTIKRSFYIFPKRLLNSEHHAIGVIGGTFIVGADAKHPHTEEFDRIIRDARNFYNIG